MSRLTGERQLHKTWRLLGIDRAVAYTLFSRGWQLLAGMGSVLLIARYLTPVQQGFQYTFASLVGMQVFFELGLTFVVMQFTSHEYAHLHWNAQGILEGDETAKARLTSLLRSTLKWYAVAAGLLLCLLAPIGLIFFGGSPDAGEAGMWQLPWLLLVAATAAALLLSPLFAVLEGCDRVAEVARFRLGQDLATYPLYWLGLVGGLGLMAAPLFQVLRLLIAAGWLFRRHRRFFADQLELRLASVSIRWRTEIWPMQWRIALSWVSGYFIFQLFNPVLFLYFGPVEAGKMGMTLTLTTAVSTLAMSWIQTKSPVFGQMVAHKDFGGLDRLFGRTLLQAMLAAVLGGAVLWLMVLLLYAQQMPLSQRILEPLPFALMTAVAILNVLISAQAIYLRAHKQEPFLWISVGMAAGNAASAYVLGRTYGAIGMAVGALAVTLAGLAAAAAVFAAKRRAWHGDQEQRPDELTGEPADEPANELTPVLVDKL